MINVQNLSYWEKESFILHSDIVIVGSGIVGLSTAIYLKQREKDKKVTVLERGFLPTGASTKNAGFSCIGSPSELLDDLSTQNSAEVFDTVEKRWKGLLNLNDLLGKDNIGYQEIGSHELFDEKSEETYKKCISELDYLNKNLAEITGKPRVFSEANDICSQYGFENFNRAISHAAEGQINTGKMMKSLLKLAFEMGVEILNGIEVQSMDRNVLSTNHGAIPFKKLVICTNGFSKRFFPDLDVEPARAQVVVTNEIPDLKLKGIFHFDAGYYYFRNVGNRVLFGGGRNLNFKGENTEELCTTEQITQELTRLLETQIIPHHTFKIEHKWAGTMGVGNKKGPIVKQIDENIYCGIRLGGMGVAIGSLVGRELSQLILNS